jgi:D-3-phosphoglycerate dehydrogenase
MSRPHILAGGALPAPGPELLRELGQLTCAPDDRLQTLAPLIADADILIARASTRVSGHLLDLAPRLRAIARTGIGVDAIDLQAATARGVPVIVVPNASARALAEGALALLLALAKQLQELDRLVRSGDWSARDRVVPLDLEGGSLAIIGYGQIGQRVGQLAQAFGMRVLAVDPVLEGTVHSQGGAAVEVLGLEEAFVQANFVTIHVPLTPVTRGMIDLSVLKRAAPGLLLVNVSRGAVAPLDALEAALEQGILGGVGLDVFDPEPPDVHHPIFRRRNLICSPHTLGLTAATWRRMFESLRDDLANILAGRRPRYVAR